MILCGHPTGNPNSHHAALAHFERHRLEAFVVPWFPSRGALGLLRRLPGTGAMARRLERRRFEPLAGARFIQGRYGEFRRLAIRALGRGDEGLSYEVNDWLMHTMARVSARKPVTAVHSFEDCSLVQFQAARRLGRACIYDMPIGYYPAWEQTQARLVKDYADWLPASGLPSSRWVRPEQKREEMKLADLVLVASTFVQKTIEQFMAKKIALAPYGVDSEFWCPASPLRLDRGDAPRPSDGRGWPEGTGEGCGSQGLAASPTLPAPCAKLRFIYAGQASLRKGIPLLLEAWRAAAVPDAELELVGLWHLAESKRAALPPNVRHLPPCSREELRERYRAADVFVFPSFFEGFGLVLLEAMACGLPAIASTATAGPDVIEESCGRVIETGSVEALVETLRWFGANRDELPAMRAAARQRAEQCTWENYRRCVAEAATPFV